MLVYIFIPNKYYDNFIHLDDLTFNKTNMKAKSCNKQFVNIENKTKKHKTYRREGAVQHKGSGLKMDI